jgi:hypothetical protein
MPDAHRRRRDRGAWGCPISATVTPAVRAIAAALLALASLVTTLHPADGQPADPVLVAAGDIAPDPFRPDLGGLDDMATAALVEGIHPDRVAPLGDNPYEYGRLHTTACGSVSPSRSGMTGPPRCRPSSSAPPIRTPAERPAGS